MKKNLIAGVIVSKNLKVFSVVGFVEEYVLFEIGEVDVDLCDANFEVDPDGNETDDESGEADDLRHRHACCG